MADVQIKARYVVKPAEATKNDVVALSELDQVAGASYVPLVYLYDKSSNDINMMSMLKESLSRALVHYYPLAGRLQRIKSGRLQLSCNAEGVELIEAESSTQLSDFGDFSDTRKFQHLIPIVDHNKDVDQLPLLFMQLTRLRCGGVTLGMLMSHGVADGTSAFYFITDWARIARGEALESYPFHDRTILRAGEPPQEKLSGSKEMDSKVKLLISQHKASSQEPMEPKETEMLMLLLTKDQVEKLKKVANVDNNSTRRPYSRYEVLAAHIWRSSCKAREHESTELRGLGIGIDARYRLPSFPKKYFGNTAFIAAAKAHAYDLLTLPIGFVCERIRKGIESVTEEYIWSDIELMKRLDDFSICQQMRALSSTEGGYVNPNPGVISWLSMPVYGLDFGWGSEVHISPGTHDWDGVSLVLPAKKEGDVIVYFSLQVAHVHKFKKYFYDDIV